MQYSSLLVRCVIVSVAILGGCAWFSRSSADESMFRSDPQHSGVYQSRALTAFHKIKWQLHTGGYVVSSPAVAGASVYVGSTDGSLYAIDRETGALRWKVHTASRVVSSPAV